MRKLGLIAVLVALRVAPLMRLGASGSGNGNTSQ